jgi:hypothetical protein
VAFKAVGQDVAPDAMRPERSRPFRACAAARIVLVERDRGFADSPLEREGFEPSVPRERDGPRAIAKVVSRWALSELMYSLPQVWW